MPGFMFLWPCSSGLALIVTGAPSDLSGRWAVTSRDCYARVSHAVQDFLLTAFKANKNFSEMLSGSTKEDSECQAAWVSI